MTAFPTYSTGTVAVANGATAITGTGSNWTGANAKPGDDIVVDGHTVVVLDVTDATHLVIDPWPFTTVSAGASYKIIKRSPLRFAGGDAMADVSRAIGALETSGYFVFVAAGDSVPDPSLGAEDQFALKPGTGETWLKSGGVWVLQGIYKGFSITGAWNSGTAYVVGDVVSLNGSSYVCILDHTNHTPPNGTYWNVLASKGDTGATGSAGSTGAAGAAGVSPGIRQAYSTTTTDSDPGAGTFRLNNATPASATAAYLDNTDAGGATVTGILDLFDDSSSTIKGVIRFQKSTDPTVWAQFNVTGSVVDGTGYRKLTLASGAGSGSFTNADVFSITFSRTGDSGSGVASLNSKTGGLAFSVVHQMFGSNGTYTPTSGMVYCIIECVGGGGGGGGLQQASNSAVNGAGGGGGAYSKKICTAADIGASKTVTVGGGGAGGVGNAAGSTGGDTSVGSLCVAKGGAGGSNSTGSTLGNGGAGGAAGSGTGDFRMSGGVGAPGPLSSAAAVYLTSGAGGGSYFGPGAPPANNGGGTQTGITALINGGGGSGGSAYGGSGTISGGAGAGGIVVITEYVIA